MPVRPITNFSIIKRPDSQDGALPAPSRGPAWLRRLNKRYTYGRDALTFDDEEVPGLISAGESVEYQFSCGDKYLVIASLREGDNHHSNIRIFLFGPDRQPLSWAEMAGWVRLESRFERWYYLLALSVAYSEIWWETGPPPLDALEIYDERRLRFHLLGQGWFELEVLQKPRRFLRWAWDCHHWHRWPWERRYMNIRRLTKGPVGDRPPGAAKQTP